MGTGQLLVEANELNKWGDLDARDDDSDDGVLDDGFERDTARLLLRVLTVRATQKLLAQLQELDLVVASWLSEFCSTHPPGAGDEFLLELMKMGGTEIIDGPNQMAHSISPADLVERILLVRADLAKRISKTFPKFAEVEGRQLRVKHLSNSYVSGTTPASRRRR